MAYNGVGIFARLYNWVADAAAGIKIKSDRMDAEMDGFATGLTNAICKDGQSVCSASIPFAQGITLPGGALGIGMTPVNVLDITQSVVGDALVKVLNPNAGVLARAGFRVSNGVGDTYFFHYGASYTTSGFARQDGGLVYTTGAGGLTLATGAAQPIYGVVNGAEAWRTEATNGAMLIGTTTMQSTARLVVATNATAAVPLRVNMSHVTPGVCAGAQIAFTGAAPDDNTSQFLVCSDTGATRFLVYSDGDVQNHDNAYGAISKREIKQDIVELPSLWDQVKSYPLRQYRMKEDVQKRGDKAPIRRGVVADEMKAVAPHLVKNDEFVVYSHMYLEAVGALQEAMARIEALEARIGP